MNKIEKSAKRKKRIKKTITDKIIIFFCTVIVIFSFIVFAYPVIFVLISSVSTVSMRYDHSLVPKTISFEGYRIILEDKQIWRSLLNSIHYTFIGTIISMCMSVLLAYALSIRDFFCKKTVYFIMVVTMYFNGGMIPTFLLIKKLGMLNTIWSLILPSAISIYNTFLLQSYFENKIPSEMYEAACLDGCGHFRYLLQFVLPLSKSILSVLSLFYAVSYWNSYFEATIYITDKNKQPFSVVLNDILIKNQRSTMETTILNSASDISSVECMQLLDYALIVVSIIPVFVIFLFIRKSFWQISFSKNKNQKNSSNKEGK